MQTLASSTAMGRILVRLNAMIFNVESTPAAVPASSGIGVVLMVLLFIVAAAYFMRRRSRK